MKRTFALRLFQSVGQLINCHVRELRFFLLITIKLRLPWSLVVAFHCKSSRPYPHRRTGIDNDSYITDVLTQLCFRLVIVAITNSLIIKSKYSLRIHLDLKKLTAIRMYAIQGFIKEVKHPI